MAQIAKTEAEKVTDNVDELGKRTADKAVDVTHAEARELGTGKSRAEMLDSLGVRSRIAPRLPVDDGIAAVAVRLARRRLRRLGTAGARRGAACRPPVSRAAKRARPHKRGIFQVFQSCAFHR
jgi:hypothetical protein